MSLASGLWPIRASTVAAGVDHVFLGFLLVCGAAAVLVLSLIVFFSIRYRKGSPYSRKINLEGENRLEWTWTIATLVLFLGLFVWGSGMYFKTHSPPRDAYEVTVVGKQWMWKFQHPGGYREINTLHVPVGRPVLLTMTSQDVIHSLFVPAFRLKQDVVPGRYTSLWFQASRPGTYHLFCTQYCGTFHAAMGGEVVVMKEADFQRWLQTGVNGLARTNISSRVLRGEALFTKMGCIACHGLDSNIHAPKLNGIYGKKVFLSDGSAVVADDNYIRESILQPHVKIVRGYEAIMPSFQGALSQDDLLALIGYIKSL